MIAQLLSNLYYLYYYSEFGKIVVLLLYCSELLSLKSLSLLLFSILLLSIQLLQFKILLSSKFPKIEL